MRIILAADHGCFNCKKQIGEWLKQQGHEVVDVGAHGADPGDDFPDFVRAAVAQFWQEENAKMILWCSSGVGVNIAANRHEGIYCGLALTVEQVRTATADNNLNALAIAAEYTLIDKQKQLIKTFLTTPKAHEERFARRLAKVDRFAREPLQRRKNENLTSST